MTAPSVVRRLARRAFGRAPLTVALAALAAAALALPAPATAARGGLHYEFETDSGGPDSLMSVETVCPVGLPVGGGIQIAGKDFSLEVAATSPAGVPISKWAAFANNSTMGSGLVEALAICGPGDMSYRPKSVSVSPGEQGNASVKCLPGTKLTGGGVTSDAGDVSMEVAETAPTPDDNGWRASMNNDPPGAQGGSVHTMTVWAACASTGHYVYRKSPVVTVHNQSITGTSVDCPRNTRVTGGGITNTGLDLGTELADDTPIDTPRDSDSLPDDGWRALAQNDQTGSGAESARVFAICKRV